LFEKNEVNSFTYGNAMMAITASSDAHQLTIWTVSLISITLFAIQHHLSKAIESVA
jgi:hypothetical protein